MIDENQIVKIKFHGATDVGQTRSLNEDNLFMSDLSAVDQPSDGVYSVGSSGAIFVVADGMGGSAAGEVASEIAVNSISKQYNSVSRWPTHDYEICDLLSRWIYNAHLKIVEEAVSNVEHLGMGTTLTVGVIIGDKLFLSWSGDSRVYRFSPNGETRLNSYDSKFLQILTPEHSLVWEMVERGEISVEDARVHKQSHIITQSLGDYNMPPKPSTKVVPLRKGDRILFCSDGLNSMVPDYMIEGILSLMNSPEETATQLIDAANKEGGYDNITVILSDIVEGPTVAAIVEEEKGNLTTQPAGNKKTIIPENQKLEPVKESIEIPVASEIAKSVNSEETNNTVPKDNPIKEIDKKVKKAQKEKRVHNEKKNKVKSFLLAAITFSCLLAGIYWFLGSDKSTSTSENNKEEILKFKEAYFTKIGKFPKQNLSGLLLEDTFVENYEGLYKNFNLLLSDTIESSLLGNKNTLDSIVLQVELMNDSINKKKENNDVGQSEINDKPIVPQVEPAQEFLFDPSSIIVSPPVEENTIVQKVEVENEVVDDDNISESIGELKSDNNQNFEVMSNKDEKKIDENSSVNQLDSSLLKKKFEKDTATNKSIKESNESKGNKNK